MTAPLGSFSGAVSGLDWRSLVDRLLEVESRPLEAARAQVNAANSRSAAWRTFGDLLDGLRRAAASLRDGAAFGAVQTTVTTVGSGGTPGLTAKAAQGTEPGTYEVRVERLAVAEKLGSGYVGSASTPLGIAGEFFVNGRRIAIAATDSLGDIRDKLNAANTGTRPANVTASLFTGSDSRYRLVLTSATTGAAGMDLVDGPGSPLGALGFFDGTTSVKQLTTAGRVRGDRFGSSSTPVATLLGLSQSVGPQVVVIEGQPVTIDLDADSLSAIADRISQLPGLSAQVVAETNGGTTTYALEIQGASSLQDSGHVLELLGLVRSGRSVVAQSVRSGVLTAGDAVTPATASTRFVDLWVGGQPAGVQAGDTLSIRGTRGDGSLVQFDFTIGATDTLQQLLDALNDPSSGFGAGSRTAAASVDADGRLQLTDAVAGDSALSLAITARNEGGGRLDFGAFEVAAIGRQTTLAAGADAELTVDGVRVRRTSNVVTDVLPGVSLQLLSADSSRTHTVTVERIPTDATAAVEGLVKAINELLGFIASQNASDPNDPASRPPLYGDPTLRILRASVADSLLQAIFGAGSGLETAAAAGVSLGKDGRVSFDRARFAARFQDRFDDLVRLFAAGGTATDGEVAVVSVGRAAQPGTYPITISTAPARARAVGSGFGGTYADDGSPDTLLVTDWATGETAAVALADGMTAAQIADALNAAFALAARHKVGTASALYTDPAGSVPMSATTAFDQLRNASGEALGIRAGDTIAYSGTRADGSSFSGTFIIQDPASTRVADLVAQLQRDVGQGASVAIEQGRIVVEAAREGASPLQLTLTARNEGGGRLDFGGPVVLVQGRRPIAVRADLEAGQLALTHSSFGSGQGFTLQFIAGGLDNTSQLGLVAGTYRGVDVAGSIGDFPAVGEGELLRGADGTPVAGLMLRYQGTSARSAGEVTLRVGVGERLARLADTWLDTSGGILSGKEAGLAALVARLNSRIGTLEGRLDRRRAQLVRQFTEMENVIGKLLAQSSALGNQVTALRSMLAQAPGR